ncbi:MAG: hypothetical protein IPH66_15970 [Crocinitomicaceae bacterium]|nr:hypothetical protein [Crocinitomicaceae bacterium]
MGRNNLLVVVESDCGQERLMLLYMSLVLMLRQVPDTAICVGGSAQLFVAGGETYYGHRRFL